ncbi:MAG: Flp pilus assembly protein CpaB [Tepidanaerobacteraceae bacterium]|nr:Flp pilus assembly protein CpaB [Tepidanaerobacteraceae bacterium]
MKNKLVFILALLLGLAAAFGTFKYMEELKQTYRQSGNYAQIATAKQHIKAKAVITEEMLEFKEMPAEYILPGTVVSAKDAVGKMAAGDIFSGEVILNGKLMSKGDPAAGLSAKVETSKRAISIPANKVNALHGLVNVGDCVDVLATFDVDVSDKKVTFTSILAQSVPVLAVNDKLQTPSSEKGELETVTLMVEPVHAQQITMALQKGSIQLVLRAPDDKELKPINSTKVEHMLR